MRKPLVLLVDDDTWLTEQMAHNLAQDGEFRVVIVPNGIEAMEQIDKQRPNVVVLDMFMPGPNGMVLLHEMQSHSDLASIPVVLCSNSTSDIPLSKAGFAQYGIREVVDKSTMVPDDLVSAVRRVLL